MVDQSKVVSAWRERRSGWKAAVGDARSKAVDQVVQVLEVALMMGGAKEDIEAVDVRGMDEGECVDGVRFDLHYGGDKETHIFASTSHNTTAMASPGDDITSKPRHFRDAFMVYVC